MKNCYTRLWARIIVVIMVVVMMAGCGPAKQGENQNTTAPGSSAAVSNTGDSAALDISEKVNLIMMTMGDAPKDLQLINDEVNKLAEKDLNCTIKFVMIPWADYLTKYNLVLSSGQPCDLIFTAPWLQFQTNARKGAYLELSELLPKYAPKLLKFVPQDMWDGSKIDGKIYTIPSAWKIYTPEGVAWREDLRKKYGVPEIKKIEDMEPYLEAIKANEPGMVPTNEGPFTDTMGAVRFVLADFLCLFRDGYQSINPYYNVYGLDMTLAKPREFIDMWESPEYLAVLKKMKVWADKGFWSRSALSNKDDIWQSFQSGKSAAVFAGMNPGRYSEMNMMNSKTNPDWEIGYLPYPKSVGVIFSNPPAHNSLGIAKSSSHPERALMLYEKIVLDKTYNHLTQYGILGKHYTITDDGHYESIGDPKTNGFTREALSGWAWYNPELNIYDRSFDVVLEMYKEFDTYAKPDYWSSFAEDYTPYQSERAAVAQVCTQYLAPIQAGLVKDVDAAMATFLQKAKEAGLDKCREGFKEQWLKYCDEQGLK